MLGAKGEPYAKGQLIVWFVKDKNPTKEQIQEICDKCGVKLLDFHGPEGCSVGFDETYVDDVMEKLWSQTEFIRNVSRNNYLYLC